MLRPNNAILSKGVDEEGSVLTEVGMIALGKVFHLNLAAIIATAANTRLLAVALFFML